MTRHIDSYRPAGSRSFSPNAARMRQRRTERYGPASRYYPAGKSSPSRDAVRTTRRRTERFGPTAPLRRRSVLRSPSLSNSPYVPRGRFSNSKTERRRPSARVDGRNITRPFRHLRQSRAGTFNQGIDETQTHECHGTKERTTFKKQQDDRATQETMKHPSHVPSYRCSEMGIAKAESPPQLEADTVAPSPLIRWIGTVKAAAGEAELNQASYRRGHSMETGRVPSPVWSPPEQNVATGPEESLPAIQDPPRSTAHERSETGSGQHQSLLQPGRARNAEDEAEDHGEDPNGGDDGDGCDSDREETEDDEHGGHSNEEDDNSNDSKTNTAYSTISGLSLPDEGFILRMLRRSGHWAAAMHELPKQRTLRCETDWKDQELKSEILEAVKIAEECYIAIKQKQQKAASLYEELMRFDKDIVRGQEKAKRQFKRMEALVTMLDDRTWARLGTP